METPFGKIFLSYLQFILECFIFLRLGLGNTKETVPMGLVRIITISREFGSGGRFIGQKLSEKLGIACYDKELVSKIAKRSGLAEEFIKEDGEYARSVSSILFTWAQSTTIQAGGGMSLSDRLYVIQHNFIQEIAEKESCVIVGRCADYILRGRTDCLNVFLHASMPFRVNRIQNEYGMSPKDPVKYLRTRDAKRKTYYRHYTNETWGDATRYHLALNTAFFGLDQSIEIILEAFQRGIPESK